MKKYLLPLLSMSLISGNVGAKVLSCDGCSPEEMFRVADDYLLSGSQVEPAYVTNLQNLTVRKYGYYNNWTPDFDPETNGLIEWSEEMPVEPEIVQVIQNAPLQGFAFAQEYRMGVDGPYDSAWQILNDPSRQADVMAWGRAQWMYYEARFIDYMRAVNPFPWMSPSQVSLHARIYFSDGTHMLVKLNTDTKEWEKAGQLLDKKKNPIPENKVDFTGSIEDSSRVFEFTHDGQNDLDNFLIEARRYQIPITGSQGSGGNVALACTRTMGVTTCVLIPR